MTPQKPIDNNNKMLQASERHSLSSAMIEFLMDCHEKELMKFPPNSIHVFRARALLKRKLLYPKMYEKYDGTKFMAVYITEAGKYFLEKNI